MDLTDLYAFLNFGYFLNYNNDRFSISDPKINKSRYIEYTESELIDRGKHIFLAAIEKSFQLQKWHLVPLSGGLDSRAVLAALLEFTPGSNISTYTFGTPGTWDYDIGASIAKKTGTVHRQFDLTKHEYKIDELLDISRRSDHQTLLFYHQPVWQIDELFRDHTIWSGFMGDPLAGSHLPRTPSHSLAEAIERYAPKNQFVTSVNLTPNLRIEISKYLDHFGLDFELLTIDEQLDFKNRQLKYVAPHVLLKGPHYVTPFLDPDWMSYILSLDNRLRTRQHLYRRILISSFPKMFNSETKNNYGLPLSANRYRILLNRILRGAIRRIHKYTGTFIDKEINYLDFSSGLRDRRDLKRIVYENILDLERRGIVNWLDMKTLWERHQKKQGDYSDALLVLASLEIHLKAGKAL